MILVPRRAAVAPTIYTYDQAVVSILDIDWNWKDVGVTLGGLTGSYADLDSSIWVISNGNWLPTQFRHTFTISGATTVTDKTTLQSPIATITAAWTWTQGTKPTTRVPLNPGTNTFKLYVACDQPGQACSLQYARIKLTTYP
jgi:hypothetical protein